MKQPEVVAKGHNLGEGKSPDAEGLSYDGIKAAS